MGKKKEKGHKISAKDRRAAAHEEKLKEDAEQAAQKKLEEDKERAEFLKGKEQRRKLREKKQKEREKYAKVRREMRERRSKEEEIRAAQLQEQKRLAALDTKRREIKLHAELARRKAEDVRHRRAVEVSCDRIHNAFERVKSVTETEHATTQMTLTPDHRMLIGTADGTVIIYGVPDRDTKINASVLRGEKKDLAKFDGDYQLYVKIENFVPNGATIVKMQAVGAWDMLVLQTEHGIFCFDLHTFQPKPVFQHKVS